MTVTDIVLEAMRQEAEYRRRLTDADPSIVAITVTLKLDNARQAIRSVEWTPTCHRMLKTQ